MEITLSETDRIYLRVAVAAVLNGSSVYVTRSMQNALQNFLVVTRVQESQ
jgi:hypothetical protein